MLNGEASPSEQEELNHLLSQDEALQQQYDLLVRIWKEKKDSIKDEYDINTNVAISRIIRRAAVESDDTEMDTRRKKRRLRIGISLIGGSLLCVLTAGWLWKSSKPSPVVEGQPVKEIIITQNGSRTHSILPDGTKVWLNAGSKLYFENDFNGATREVRLEGEAFFDVVKQTNRPFIVHTSGIDIKVLGTAFNVKSYPEDKNVETTLYRGSVQVLRHEDATGNAIQLKPNEKLIVSKQAAIEEPKLSEDKTPSRPEIINEDFVRTFIDSTKKESERLETAWRFNRLEFEGANFEEVAKKLERWYNVTIDFSDERLKQLDGVTGKFENEPVGEVFEALKKIYPIKYKILNNHEIFVESSQ